MELDVSFVVASGAKINGSVPIRSEFPPFTPRTRLKNLHVSCELSASRMAHCRPAITEACSITDPVGPRLRGRPKLASDFLRKWARMGLGDNKRITETRLPSGVPVSPDNGQAYLRLDTRAAFKDTKTDPWESRKEVTEMDTSSTSIDQRGREASFDDSELTSEREIADEGIAEKANDRAGSARSIENEGVDNRNIILGANTAETRSRKGEWGAEARGMSHLSFRTGGNAADYGARDTIMDDRTDRSRLDLRYGRQIWTEEDAYEDGETKEQTDLTNYLNEPERSKRKYAPGGTKEVLKWRDQEAPLELSRKTSDEGDGRGLFVNGKRKELNATAGITENRKTLKRSKLMAKQIISQSSAMALGFVSQMWVNTVLWQVTVLEVKPSLLSGEMEGVLLNDVCQVGDVILVSDESALDSELTVLESESLVGYDLLTEDGYSLGKVRDYNFTLSDGKVTSLEFDSLGFSLVPSNLISTYWLDINEVMSVSSESLLIKLGAESRARRLSKGILQLPRVQGRSRSQRLAENQRWRSMRQEVSYERRQMPLQTRQLPSRSSTSSLKDVKLVDVDRLTGLGDRWSPMDYGSSQRKA